MLNKSTLTILFASLMLAAIATRASALTFEEPMFEHGTVVADEYAPFVTISADNTGGDLDLAVTFDSSFSNAQDSDLEAPFYSSAADTQASAADTQAKKNVVPLPASFWLFGTALLGFIGYSRRTTI